ncbi:MAG: SusC/RagA family TonB-linked outer membrane protein [Pseudopedobacter saltans]|uniref:SusC/RagA family TonB-linked outer membrane protein n=1 Tax=Pseudopedobacter saltans TaxID=151895 RepID=A0A2W5EY16_9SPHI|nr:MAG: SusC/RagA family TonB-linked outer membrane protein [Pseudopedobacter saltans]
MNLYVKNDSCLKIKRLLFKIGLIMRITAFILLIACVHVSARSKAQKITIRGSHITLEKLAEAINSQTNYQVVYDPELLKKAGSVSLSLKNTSLKDALEESAEAFHLDYEIKHNTIVFKRGYQADVYSSKNNWMKKEDQLMNITGTIRDKAGEFLPNVSVSVVGANRGTMTDALGNFSIQADKNDSLRFSLVGYVEQTVMVGNNRVLYITMDAVAGSLNDVVVVGFGQQRKISLVGAQSTLKPEELKQPVADMTTMLAGRIAGVIGVQRSGQPGNNQADIWIRGISTFGGNSSSPLILVDGVQRSINNIDPQDVASFTILKDAVSTAVYGINGANGVVLITTKKGRIGKPEITLNYNEGITTYTKLPHMADAKQYMEAANEANTTRGYAAIYSDDYISKTLSKEDPLLYPDVNWFDELYNKWGNNRRFNASAGGGVSFAKYYISLAYYDEKGMMKTDGLQQYNSDIRFRRYNFTTNVNVEVSKTTKVDLGIQGYFTNNNRPAISTDDIFNSAMTNSPVEYPVMYPGGFIPGVNPNGGYRNPYADLTTRGYSTGYDNQINSNLRLTQDLSFWVRGLSFSSMFAFDAYNTQSINRTKRLPTYFPDINKPYNEDGSLNLIMTYAGTGDYLSYSRGNSGNRSLYSETSLNYANNFGKHRVSGLALFYTKDQSDNFAGDFTSYIPTRQLGLAGRATYSYDDRYFVEGDFGYNGTGEFAPKDRYGFFPSFGTSWVVSNEKFFEPIKKVLSYFKIRYSDGLVGINTLPGGRRFGFLTVVSPNQNGYTYGQSINNSFSGIAVTAYPGNVHWAQSRKQDLGIEFKMFDDHLSVIADLFQEHRTGIFLQRQSLPLFMGISNAPYGNLGEVKNKGIDGTLVYDGRIGKLDVNIRGNVTFNKDVLEKDDMPPQPYPWMNHTGNNILAIYGYQADGLFKDQADIDASAVPGSKQTVLPGDIKYKDLNGDGYINAQDVTKIGRGDVPSCIYGFGFNVGYQGFNIGALFQGSAGAEIMLRGSSIYPFNNDAGISNIYSNIGDRWTESNPSQDVFYPRLAYGQAQNYNNTQASSWWVKKVDFVRLKSLQLSYNLPKSWIKNTSLKNGMVYLQAINPITFSNFKLWDPEMSAGANGGDVNGGHYPNIVTYSVGLTVNF